jgi:hypothetical protein
MRGAFFMSADPAYYEPPAPPAGGIYPEKPNVLGNMQEQYVTDDGFSWVGSRTLSPNRIDEVTTTVTPETFEEMSQDPKIHKSKRIRINGVLTDELILATGATEAEVNESEYKKFVKVMHFCERMVSGLETPLWRVLEMMLDGGYEQGHKIAESDWEYRIDKPTKKIQTGKKNSRPSTSFSLRRFFGLKAQDETPKSKRGTTILSQPQTRLMPRAIKVKPRGAALFVVDAFLNVLGLVPSWNGARTWYPNQVITRDKFLVFTNNPVDDDPRGTSAWRPSFWAWSFKNFIPRQYLTYLLNEAVPVPVLTLPKGMQSWLVKRDEDQNIIYKKDPITGDLTTEPELIETVKAAELTLKNVRGGQGVAIPFEAKLDAYGGNRGGAQDTVFPNAISSADEQIEESILLQPLAQSQGGSNSQKGAMTHENRLVDSFYWDKRSLCTMLLYDFFAVGVRMNLGEEWLAYMPKASLGDSEKRDWARDLEVISKAYFYGFIDDTQRAELCAWLSLPKPGPSRAEMLMQGQGNPNGAQQGKDGAPAPDNNQRPDKQPENKKRNDGNSTPKQTVRVHDDQMEDSLEALYEQVATRETAEQGFSTLGYYARRRKSFVEYRH